MATDMFLKLDGIKGESADDKHKGEIDIMSWSWGAAQTGSSHGGAGGGTGKVSVSDITVMKLVDKSTTALLSQCFSGKHIKEGVLVVRKAGGSPLEYMKITFDSAIVSSVQYSGGGGERIQESISFNFAKVKCEYTPQKADGTGDAVTTAAYDISANKAT